MLFPRNPVFSVRETHRRAERPQNRVLANSDDLGWRSLHAAIIEEAPLQTVEAPVHHPSLIYHLSRPTEVSRKVEGNARERTIIGPRRLCLTPGEAAAEWEHCGRPEILQVYLRQSVYAAAVNEIHGCEVSSADIVPRFAIADPLLEELALLIVTALREGAEDGLYIESIAQMIAVHLARKHSVRSTLQVHPSRGQLAEGQLTGPKLRRLIDFIEANLERDLTLEKMAAEVGISKLYLPRAFKAAFGQTPHQYVLRRRIERAKALLRGTSTPVAEVAFAAGFSSQSHLSNWFTRVMGVSPAAYRRQG
jgi:AraC family transcriptional regulator